MRVLGLHFHPEERAEAMASLLFPSLRDKEEKGKQQSKTDTENTANILLLFQKRERVLLHLEHVTLTKLFHTLDKLCNFVIPILFLLTIFFKSFEAGPSTIKHLNAT